MCSRLRGECSSELPWPPCAFRTLVGGSVPRELSSPNWRRASLGVTGPRFENLKKSARRHAWRCQVRPSTTGTCDVPRGSSRCCCPLAGLDCRLVSLSALAVGGTRSRHTQRTPPSKGSAIAPVGLWLPSMASWTLTKWRGVAFRQEKYRINDQVGVVCDLRVGAGQAAPSAGMSQVNPRQDPKSIAFPYHDVFLRLFCTEIQNLGHLDDASSSQLFGRVFDFWV